MSDLFLTTRNFFCCFVLTVLPMLTANACAVAPAHDTSRWEQAVLNLDYDGALNILLEENSADPAGVLDGLTEMAYYFAETGMPTRSLVALSALFKWQDRTEAAVDELYKKAAGLADNPEKQELIREILRRTNLPAFERCEKRYYPDMVAVQGSTFMMGCGDPEDVSCEPNEKPYHRVKLSDFSMSRTEVTVWQFALFCAATGRSLDDFAGNWIWKGNHPMMNIQWYDAADYCNWLTTSKLKKGTPRYRFVPGSAKPIDRFLSLDTRSRGHYRLPTEAEWEYAARGGVYEQGYQRYSGGYSDQDSSLNAIAWWGKNPRLTAKSVQPVAQLRPNLLGIFDMIGNAWEWCEDEYTPESYENFARKGVAADPLNLNKKEAKTEAVILRGGSWYEHNPDLLRNINRDDYYPYDRLYNIGFRVVWTKGR